MPIGPKNQRTFHKRLYSGMLETVRLLKRGNDQQQGTVTAYTLFQCRRSIISRTGESIQQDIEVDTRTVWHLPTIELERIGVAFINNLDRIVDNIGRYWQPEANVLIQHKLFSTHSHVHCLRVDPPNTTITKP